MTEQEHVCCPHQQHIAIGGSGCCNRGHAAWLMAEGVRPMADEPCGYAAPDEHGICEACGWPKEEHDA